MQTDIPPPVEPEIEVRTEYELALEGGMGTAFDPERHEIHPTEWSRWAIRLARNPNMFMYRHKLQDSFVLAVWVLPPIDPDGRGGLMTEIHAIPSHPDHYSKGFRVDVPSSEYMRARFRPVDEQIKAVKRKMASAREAHLLGLEKDKEARRKTGHNLIKKGKHYAHWGRAVQSGEIPIAAID